MVSTGLRRGIHSTSTYRPTGLPWWPEFAKTSRLLHIPLTTAAVTSGHHPDKEDLLDRDLESLSRAPVFTWRRLLLTLMVSSAVITAASFLVRTFPNSGYQAGYDAVIGKDGSWVRSEVDGAAGTALPVCEGLHIESETSPNEPRYEYESFIDGCSAAVDLVSGRHIPLLPGG